jgi:divalent metal cation (Fe/Co/Zn/Cd) transporter
MATTTPLRILHSTVPDPDRPRLIRRAQRLAWFGIAWHVAEAAIAIAAGLAASSIALIGFGADSVIESVAGFVVLWLFAAPRAGSARAERRAQQTIAISFYVLALYIAVEAIHSLIANNEPATSWIGIALAAVTLIAMPPLAKAKERVATQLDSSATAAEGRQNMLCAYLSAALLLGLGANALFAVAVREGRDSWRGDSCSCCAPVV